MSVDIRDLFTFSDLSCASSAIAICKVDSYHGTNPVTNTGTVW